MGFALIELLILLIGLLLVAFVVTQVVIPLFQGTSLFPLLLRKSSKLQSELASTRTEVQDSEVVKAIEQERQRIYKPSNQDSK